MNVFIFQKGKCSKRMGFILMVSGHQEYLF